jgi:uroporphyrinogen-III decarboxylase
MHDCAIEAMRPWALRQASGEAVVWITLEGCFWFPRTPIPTFATIAKDMSYNNGQVISEKHFDEFITPYYRRIIPRLEELEIIPLVDTDGDVTRLVPWLLREGIVGVPPLERQAGVDGLAIRRRYPEIGLVGHYDKMVMTRGELAMRNEFERLLSLMRSGRFIPSVDHQTPPGVSLTHYKAYVRLLTEYATR